MDRGSLSWSAFFTGTNAGNVLVDICQHTVCPKWYFENKTIILMTRFREKDKKALKNVLKLAKKTDAQYTVCIKTDSRCY
jgi:hypothetical protein